MYTLHIANKNYSSWSLRPWVLMKELNIPFEEKLHVFGESADWAQYKAINKAGLVPCLTEGEHVIWDSLAIIEFLAESHSGVWPSDKFARAWARSATAEMHSGFSALRNQCPMNCGVRVKLNETTPALTKDIARLDELWQEGLERFSGPFLAGAAFSAIDAFFAPVAFRCKTYNIELSPKSSDYLEKILSTNAMRIWYTQALDETYRDVEHDIEICALGEIIEDFRNA